MAVGSSSGLSRGLAGTVQHDTNDRKDDAGWRGCYAVMRCRLGRSKLLWLGESLGVYICVARRCYSHGIPRMDKDGDLLWSKPNGLGTRRDSEIETNTDAAGWTGNFALACSQVVMRNGHRSYLA